MTSAEFQQWFDHFAAAFPAVKDFVRKGDRLGTRPEQSGKATLTLWFEVLKKRELADALAVTNGMFNGDLAAIPGTDRGFPDWSQVPRHVSRLCGELHPVVPEWKQPTFRARSKKSLIDRDPVMARTFKESLRILDDGGTMDDVRAYLDGEFGTSSRVADKPNYEPAFEAFSRGEEF